MAIAIEHPPKTSKTCTKCGFSENANLESIKEYVNSRRTKYRRYLYRGENSFGIWINNRCPQCNTELKRRCMGEESRETTPAKNIRKGWESERLAMEHLRNLGFSPLHLGGQGKPDISYEREGDIRRVEVKTTVKTGVNSWVVSKCGMDVDDYIFVHRGHPYLVDSEFANRYAGKTNGMIRNVTRILREIGAEK